MGTKEGTAMALGPGLLLTDSHGHELFVTEKAPKRKLRAVRVADGETALVYADSVGTDVWQVAHDEARPEHSTQKPVGLATRALLNSSKPGDVVYDAFLGSGTALIGAERTGRACRGLELEPRYCDLTVRRWEDLTGGKAEREEAKP
jgi:DNA modification methylase